MRVGALIASLATATVFFVSSALATAVGAPPSDRASLPDALVYVRDDDPDVRARIARAREAAASGRYSDAIDAWIEVLEDPRDQLAAWGPRTHASATETARRALADLPPDGTAMLEGRFGEPLAARLAEATERFDLDALEELARGIPTRATRRAAIRLADLRLERGDPAGALRALHLLRQTYARLPDDVTEGALGARIAFARARLGEPAFVDPLTPLPPDTSTRIGGDSVDLAAYVRSLAGEAAPVEDSWFSFGGDFAHRGFTTRPRGRIDTKAGARRRGERAERAEADDSGASPGPRLERTVAATPSPKWTFDGLPGTKDADAPDGRPLRSPEQEPNPIQPMHPLVTDDLVIAYNKASVVALRRDDGSTAWQRDLASLGAVPPGEKRTYFYASASEDGLAIVHESVPVDDRKSAFDPPPVYVEGPRRELALLSTADGTTRWERGGVDDPDEDLRSLELTGPPVFVGDLVCIGAKREAEEEGEVKAWALAFDRRDGSLVWSRFLASSPALDAMRHVFPEGPTLAYGEGFLYCSTQIGVLSCLDPETGEHLWCFRYERIPYRTRDDSRLLYSYFESWSDDPLIVHDGRIYLTPGDSQHLHVILFRPDRATGYVQLQRVEKAGFRYLAGVRDRVVFLVGQDSTSRHRVVSAWQPEGGERAVLWTFPIPSPSSERKDAPADRPTGRALLSGNRLFLPTYKGLSVVDADTGDLVRQIAPPDGVDGVDVRFGNLAAAGRDIVSAYRFQLTCFRSEDLGRAR